MTAHPIDHMDNDYSFDPLMFPGMALDNHEISPYGRQSACGTNSAKAMVHLQQKRRWQINFHKADQVNSHNICTISDRTMFAEIQRPKRRPKKGRL